jgi:hypothetical protein
MTKLVITVAATAFALGTMAQVLTANAQTQGAATIHAQAQNATPIHKAACGGWGRWCPPGSHRVCGPMRCWCAPC